LSIDLLGILTGNDSKPIRRRVTWLGHSTQDIQLGRTVDGRGLLSKGHSGDSIAWGLDANCSIQRRAVLPFENACLSVTLLGGMRPSEGN
jgi:hypothetical protein